MHMSTWDMWVKINESRGYYLQRLIFEHNYMQCYIETKIGSCTLEPFGATWLETFDPVTSPTYLLWSRRFAGSSSTLWRVLVWTRLPLKERSCIGGGGVTPPYVFVTMCDNGVFNGGIFMHFCRNSAESGANCRLNMRKWASLPPTSWLKVDTVCRCPEARF